MPMTDRGIVAVQQESDGTLSVVVCAGIKANQPYGVFAKYSHVPSELVRSTVPLRAGARFRHTDEIAQVSVGEAGRIEISRVPETVDL
jgi:hypothetical protein